MTLLAAPRNAAQVSVYDVAQTLNACKVWQAVGTEFMPITEQTLRRL
jgi:hypothetical protein